MILNDKDLCVYQKDLFNIVVNINDIDESQIKNYVIKSINLNGARETFCINFYSDVYGQIVQTIDYKPSILNKMLRKQKINKINEKFI